MHNKNLVVANDKVESVAIFGGSFDPVQKAHKKIIKELSERFNRVIVVPAFVSPFKKNVRSAPSYYRVKMLKEATEKFDNVDISKWEINNEGLSYTYNTVRHYADKFPYARISFVMGGDMLDGLHKWYNIEELIKLVDFYVVEREGFVIAPSVIKKLDAIKANITNADFTVGAQSSAQARVDAAFDKYTTVPSKVKKIIVDNKLYQEYKPFVDAYKVFGLKQERIIHTYQTALTALNLAKIHNANISDTIVAALLHDLTKNADEKMLTEQGFCNDEYKVPKSVSHAFTAAEAAKKYFKIRKKSIINAIKYHTTGSADMDKIAKIVFLSDYIEPGRIGEHYERVRAIAPLNLDWAVAETLEYMISYLESKDDEICELTYEAYEAFKGKKKDKTKIDISTKKVEKDDKKEEKENKVKKEEMIKKETLKQEMLQTKDEKTENAEETENAVEVEQVEKKVAKPLTDNRNKDPQNNPEDMAYEIAACLDKHKGEDITVIDLMGKTIIADYLIIATVYSSTAVRALTDYVDERLSREYHIEPLRRDIDAKWAAIDYGSVIMHVQVEDVRKFYDIERLWTDGTNTTRFKK